MFYMFENKFFGLYVIVKPKIQLAKQTESLIGCKGWFVEVFSTKKSISRIFQQFQVNNCLVSNKTLKSF